MSPRTLADSLHERLLRTLPANQAYASADWKIDAVPGPVQHYLDHLLRHHGQREARRLRRARSDWVNYDHPEMEQATRTFLDAVSEYMQVPRDQWDEALRTATHRVTDYLVRPVPTLTSFVFEEASGPVPIAQIQWRMRFFGPYAYLRNAIEAYAEKRDQDAFSPDAFERTLRRVDERMTDDFDADRWGRLLAPLFETAQRATGREEVPLSLLRTFFEEKNAARIADRLVDYRRDEGADAVGPDALRRLIRATPSPTSSEQSDASASPSPEPSLEPDLQDAADASPASRSGPPSTDEDRTGATPMWKQFEQTSSGPSPTTGEADDGAQPLWTQFRTQGSSSRPEAQDSSSRSEGGPGGPSPSSTDASSGSPDSSTSASSPTDPDRESSLSALERDVFGSEHPPNRSVYIRELFGGDGDAYREILERLRTTESWSTASQIIASDVFRAHQVNIYSDAAVHFTNAVEAGFKEP